MRIRSAALLTALLLASSPPVFADAERGALLYDGACGQCHTTQPHWRDQHLVHSWDDLLKQVQRWQRVAGQSWSDEDVRDVASYLNGRFYHVPCTDKGCTGREASSGSALLGDHAR